MNEHLSKFVSNNNEIFTILSFFIGIIGLAIGIFSYLKSKKVKRLSYEKHSFNLVNDSISKFPKLELKYDNNKISNLSITKLILWNSGNETIDKKDIISSEQIHITKSNDTIIYNIEIKEIVEKSNNFLILEENNSWNIIFDYIDPQQGISIEIFHSKISSKDIKIKGKIKGLGQIKENIMSGDYSTEERLINSGIFPFKEMTPLISNYGWSLYMLGSVISLFFIFYKSNYWLIFVTAFCALASYAMYPSVKAPKGLKEK